MKIAALYDIHGNLPALQAVLQEIEQSAFDLIVIGGDIVLGPFPNQTLQLLLNLGDRVRFIRGNCDRLVVTAFDTPTSDRKLPPDVQETITWTAQQLDTKQKNILGNLPEHLRLSREELGTILFCHASPRSDEEILTVATPEARLRETLVGITENIIVCGHTHMQYERHLDDKIIVNAGSVGMPYGEPGAYWLELGQTITARYTAYNLEAAAAMVRASTYPQAENFAEHSILQPASIAKTIKLFEQRTTQGA